MKIKWNKWTKPFWIIIIVQIVINIILWLLPIDKTYLHSFNILRGTITGMSIGTTIMCLIYIDYWSDFV